jgi:hypothetical protein
VVRGKLFTLDLRLVRGELGTLADADQAGVETMLRALLGMRSEAP